MTNNVINSLFSACLYDETALTYMVSKCRNNTFYGDANSVYEVFKQYSDTDSRIDPSLFAYSCDQKGVSKEFVQDIINGQYNIDSIEKYIEKVILDSTKVQLNKFQSKVNEKINTANTRADLLLLVEEALDKSVFSQDFGSEDSTVNAADKLNDYLAYLQKNASNADGMIGLKTPFSKLNKVMRGLVPKDLIILGGRPSMGKTAMAMSLFLDSILKGEPGIFFSLEMPWEQMLNRLFCSIGSIQQDNLRTGRLTNSEQASFQNCQKDLIEKIKLHINDTAGLTLSEIKRIAYNLHKKYASIGGLKYIIIDYLQLMSDADVSGDTRAERIGKITSALKSLAKELDIPILLLSQLSRDLERRPDKRPINADLRESGAIEQDADVILFVYRDEVYNEKSKDIGFAELIISKQRNGPLDTVRVKFEGKYARFSNCEQLS